MTALALEGLSKRFGALAAVDGVTLSVAPGERLGLIGPNGAGKSTLFALAAGALRPDAGRVRLDGRDVTGLGPAARARAGLARSFQRTALFEGLSVAETLTLADLGAGGGGWLPWPRPDPARAARVTAAAEAIGLGALLERPAASLSYGERRQLELAAALAGRPRVLLLDEPTAGMSPAETARTRALIEALPREVAVVLVEHDLELVFGLAERIAMLAGGRLAFDGAPEAARRSDAVRAAYLEATAPEPAA